MGTNRVIHLPDDVWQRARQANGLMEAKRLELDLLQQGLAHLLQTRLRVDFTREHWQLDLERGLLLRERVARGSHK